MMPSSVIPFKYDFKPNSIKTMKIKKKATVENEADTMWTLCGD